MIIKTPTSDNQSLATDIFLAGGISNCPDWQAEALRLLEHTDLVVANPRRPEGLAHTGEEAKKQIEWEFANIKTAGIVLFWFPGTEFMQPITLFELGKQLGRGCQIVVGADPAFSRAFDVAVQTRLERPQLTVHSTLESTVEAAVDALKQN